MIRATTITTQRLTLLPLRVDHAEEMAAVLSDPELHAFIGGSPLSLPELRKRYGRLVAGSPEPGVTWHNWVIQANDGGSLAGTVQATVQGAVSLGPVAEVSWVVGTAWQGRGIAREAARGLVRWLREQGVQKVIAHVNPDHAASAAVAVAAGLSPTEEVQDGEIRWQRDLSALRTE